MTKIKKLRYAGSVGTGYSVKTLHKLKTELDKIERAGNPFARQRTFLATLIASSPMLVAEVSFSE